MDRITIALDAMGGDHGPSESVPAALAMLNQHPELELILVGNIDTLNPVLTLHHYDGNARLKLHQATEVVDMDEAVASALRLKKDSSMRVAINLVKDQKAQAAVSSGNTGALMAIARFVLKTIEGIDRPAIISLLPTFQSGVKTRMLDLGANVDSTPQHLFEFAVMGSVISETIDGVSHPKIALLSNGKEDIKGNDIVKAAAKLLGESKALNFIGYVEADELFSGVADVIVCDGFVGNVSLKACEGTVKTVGRLIKKQFNQNWLTKAVAFAAMPVLKSLSKQIDPARYNGATLAGLQGVVIKSHGAATRLGIAHAIYEAMAEVRKDVLTKIRTQVSQLLGGHDEL